MPPLHYTGDNKIPNVMRSRWRREAAPDATSIAVTGIIAAGLLVTLLLMAITLDQYASHLGGPRNYIVHALLAFALGIALWMKMRRNEVNSWIRLCSFTLVMHLLLLAAAYGLYLSVKSSDSYLRESLTEAETMPVGPLVLLAAMLLFSYVRWSGGRGRHSALRIIRSLYIAVLVFVVVLGLWMPILIEGTVAFDTYSYLAGDPVQFHQGFLWRLLMPPSLIALLFCIPRIQRWVLSTRRGYFCVVFGGILVGMALVKACIAAAQLSLSLDQVVYLNCLPILVGAIALCLLLIIAMAVCHWHSLRGTHKIDSNRTMRGVVISTDSEPVGRVHYEGWLPGMRIQTSAFVLRGEHGDVPVPSSRLIASLPTWTVGAKAGQSAVVLKAGDPVEVHGFVKPQSAGPFRASSVPVLGADGVVVIKIEPSLNFWREFVLIAWRPVILYLLVAAIVAIPGLVSWMSWQAS